MSNENVTKYENRVSAHKLYAKSYRGLDEPSRYSLLGTALSGVNYGIVGIAALGLTYTLGSMANVLPSVSGLDSLDPFRAVILLVAFGICLFSERQIVSQMRGLRYESSLTLRQELSESENKAEKAFILKTLVDTYPETYLSKSHNAVRTAFAIMPSGITLAFMGVPVTMNIGFSILGLSAVVGFMMWKSFDYKVKAYGEKRETEIDQAVYYLIEERLQNERPKDNDL